MHCVEKRWHVRDGLPVPEDRGVLWRGAWLGPPDTFPWGVILGHEIYFVHKVSLPRHLCGRIVVP